MSEANNFNNSLVLDRVIAPPSFIKLLLSEYGVIKIYENSKGLLILSLINMIMSVLISIILLSLSSVFLSSFIEAYDTSATENILTLVVLCIVITSNCFTILVFLLGVFKRKSTLIKKRIGFDSLSTNIIINLSLLIILLAFTMPGLELDPLVPITSTEANQSNFLIEITKVMIVFLAITIFWNFTFIVISQVLKNGIVKKRLKKLMVDATMINTADLEINLDKKTVNQIIFEKIKKTK